ncbi:MAG: L-threonylcarbamoyladenylate synthase [bacterium]|nr:L-threonylcarbamoyladenylate synthase [bacterium]
MKIIKINLNKVLQDDIDLIADYLKCGQVIAYPTDTVYGLGCNAGTAAAVKKIRKIKGDRTNKPRLALVSGWKMLKKYCRVSREQMKYLKKIWPGKVTIILTPAEAGQKEKITPAEAGQKNNEGLAVRLPKNDFLIKIISQAGFPLVSTSLNRQGEKPLTSVKSLAKHFKYLPDLAIDAGEIKGRPSSIVDLRDVKNIKIIRK